jgi:hypothetical protein
VDFTAVSDHFVREP